MTDDQQQLFDNYSNGSLSDTEKQQFLDGLQNDSELKNAWDLYQLTTEALKADNEASIRAMLKEIDKSNETSKDKGRYNKWWILASILGALIIIFGVAMVEFNKLEPTQVADQFRLTAEQRIQRSTNLIPVDSTLTVGYYLPLDSANNYIDNKQYDKARQAIGRISLDADVIQQNKEWMMALISYMENGRSDPYFQSILAKILDDSTHNNYPQAVKLNDKVNNFWGRLLG